MAPFSGAEMTQMEMAAKNRDTREIASDDLIKVVRCRNCRHRWKDSRGRWQCAEMAHTIDAGYCWRGERKEKPDEL